MCARGVAARVPPRFDAYVGIDYSGAGSPADALPGIAVAEARARAVRRVAGPFDDGRWSRRAVAEWLLARLERGDRVVVGMDFAFSLPVAALGRRRVASWDAMLRLFRDEWRTHERAVSEARREVAPWGSREERRLCDEEAVTAKSPFFFGGPGNVGYATHAGLPWLAWLRERAPEDVAFWPYDAHWPEARALVAEAYPALYRPRYLVDGRYRPARPTRDAEDAHATARWLRDEDRADCLDGWLRAPRDPQARALAAVEGWILGVA